jgi:hypothetical protein
LNASTEEGIANNNVTIVETLLKCILSFDKAWRKKRLLGCDVLWGLVLAFDDLLCLLLHLEELSTHYLHSTPTTSFLSATTSPLIHVGINTKSARVWKNRCQFWRRGCHLYFRGQW